ncbi:MAG: hypothetical protein IJT29_00365 [Oscillospiraceae bacterium]|nr:hypothetical protein [Oscillospiraceae bacterium]
MKRKRMAAALLALAVMLTLAGCGSFAGRMAGAARKMAKVQSYRVDLSLDTALNITVLGREMPAELAVNATGDVNTEPARSRLELTTSLLGERGTLLAYTERTGEDYTLYLSPDGSGIWTKQTLDAEGADRKTGLAGLLKLASRFEKTGVESVRGSEATVFAGSFSGEELDRAVALSDTLEGVLEALELEEGEITLEDCGSVPVTVAIDNKSGLVTRCTLDLTELMQELMPKLMDAVMAETAEQLGLENVDLSLLGFALDIGRVSVTAELYDFDAAAPVEIPAEALAAPEG